MNLIRTPACVFLRYAQGPAGGRGGPRLLKAAPGRVRPADGGPALLRRRAVEPPGAVAAHHAPHRRGRAPGAASSRAALLASCGAGVPRTARQLTEVSLPDTPRRGGRGPQPVEPVVRTHRSVHVARSRAASGSSGRAVARRRGSGRGGAAAEVHPRRAASPHPRCPVTGALSIHRAAAPDRRQTGRAGRGRGAGGMPLRRSRTGGASRGVRTEPCGGVAVPRRPPGHPPLGRPVRPRLPRAAELNASVPSTLRLPFATLAGHPWPPLGGEFVALRAHLPAAAHRGAAG